MDEKTLVYKSMPKSRKILPKDTPSASIYVAHFPWNNLNSLLPSKEIIYSHTNV